MLRRFDEDPTFKNLIIVPDRWRNADRLVSSPGTYFLTWSEVCRRNYSGMRFNQIIAMSPPVGDEQSAAWGALSRILISGGIQIEL